jgi:hypothetical protein
MASIDIIHVVVGGEQILKVQCAPRREPPAGAVLADSGRVRLLLVDKRRTTAQVRQSAASIFAEQKARSMETVARFLLNN